MSGCRIACLGEPMVELTPRQGGWLVHYGGDVLNIALHCGTLAGKSVGIFSLEMSKEQLFLRMLTAEARIDAHRLRGGFLGERDWGKLSEAIGTARFELTAKERMELSSLHARHAAERRRDDERIERIAGEPGW